MPQDQDAAGFEWCEIRRWRGYAKSTFYAVTADGEVLAESEPFRWRKDALPPETPAARAAHDTVVAAVCEEGWTISDGENGYWYATRLTRPARSPQARVSAPPAQDAAEIVEAAPVAPAPVASAAPAPVAPAAPAPVAPADPAPVAPVAPAPVAPPPPAAAPTPPPTPRSPETPTPPVPTTTPPEATEAESGSSRRGRRRRRVAVAGGPVALVAIAAVALPSTLRGTPSPVADVAHHHLAKKTNASAKPLSPSATSTTGALATTRARARVDLRIAAHGNGSWIEVRRRSASGPRLYEATLASGQRLHFRGARLWVRFGAAGNLSITADGRQVRLSGTEAKVFVPQ
jgi:RodZ C-terminal domain